MSQGVPTNDEINASIAEWQKAQVAAAARTAPPPPPPQYTPAVPPPVDPDSPEAWYAAGAEPPPPNLAPPGTPDGPAFGPPPPPPKAAATGWSFEGGRPVTAPSGYQTTPAAPETPKKDAPPEGEQGQPPPPAFAGAPAQVIPAGMYPDKMSIQVKEGKPVPAEAKAAYGAATEYGIQSAQTQRDADKAMFEHERHAAATKLLANEDAMAQHQKIQAARDAEVKKRLANIESLNAQAQGHPSELWGSKQALAGFISAIAVGLGAVAGASGSVGGAVAGALSGKLLEGFMNQDINAKLDARKSAGAAATREGDLLDLHLANFKDQDRAVDATKLAYYDNALTQLDQYRAEHGIAESDAGYQKMLQGILTGRADLVSKIADHEAADVMRGYDEKWQNAKVLGGGGGGVRKEPGNILTYNGTSYQMPNEQTFNKAVESIEAKQRLIRMNNDIAKLRKETAGLDPLLDHGQYQSNIARLEEMEQTKLKAVETAEKQGVLRDGEYGRAKELTGHATTGLGLFKGNPWAAAQRAAGDAVIDQQNKRWTEDLQNIPRAAGAHIVDRRFMRDPNSGELVPVAPLTGQTTAPSPGLAPSGFRPADPKKSVPTMPQPDRKTTPYTPEVPYRPTAPSGGKKKRG